MPELAPEAFDECGRGRAIVRKLLVAHLAENGRERIDLTDRRRGVVLHLRIEAASARRVRAVFVDFEAGAVTGARRSPTSVVVAVVRAGEGGELEPRAFIVGAAREGRAMDAAVRLLHEEELQRVAAREQAAQDGAVGLRERA